MVGFVGAAEKVVYHLSFGAPKQCEVGGRVRRAAFMNTTMVAEDVGGEKVGSLCDVERIRCMVVECE